MKVDMSKDAVTNRMKALDQLWELSVALKSSRVQDVEATATRKKERSDVDPEKNKKGLQQD